MGKPKDSQMELSADQSTTNTLTSPKKHKKHKHKKHKKKKDAYDNERYIDASKDADLKKTIKLKIKRDDDKGNETRFKDKIIKLPPPVVASTSMGIAPKIVKKKIMKTSKSKDSGTSSEEERWLDAIESGKLEEVDEELKKIKPKDPKLMTARQRAMFERKTDAEPNSSIEQLMSLPTGYKEKVMTAEAIQKAALKSIKRKQLADEKREKDKKKTMERLLKKQESKVSKVIPKGKVMKRQVPLITYKTSLDKSLILLPLGQDFPLKASKSKEQPQPTMCGIPSCSNRKRYSCSKTGIPLCSLECYKANLMSVIC